MFKVGQTVMTRGFLGIFQSHYGEAEGSWQAHLEFSKLLQRHTSGDWGDLEEEDKKANEDAVKNGSQILSKYYVVLGDDEIGVYFITEGDRSITTALLLDEY